MVLVTTDVTWHSWRLLSVHGGRSAIPEVVQAFSHRGLSLGPALVEFAASGLLWGRLLSLHIYVCMKLLFFYQNDNLCTLCT